MPQLMLIMAAAAQDHTVNLLRKLRERIPGLVLRTTFISGFPGESDAQHKVRAHACASGCYLDVR